MKNKLASLILNNAQTITALVTKVNQSYKDKVKHPLTWQQATEQLQSLYDQLAFPGGLEHGLQLLKAQDPNTTQIAIDYLEVNPYFFRSGYIKEKIIRLLKKINVSEQQKKQLQEIIINVVKNKPRRELREYARLALKIGDDTFYAQLHEIKKSSDNLKVKSQVELILKNT
ncbi:hypothetical protein H0X48_06680 [Candidatus Dependentiae bacterium]|nr:hypothetical protein [Candidatus Dependentiae bacterium]